MSFAFEEENFYKTIDTGLTMLNDIVNRTDAKVLSGEDAFLLSDTFGFPIDLTKDILDEKGMSVDEDRFRALVLQQRETAREAARMPVQTHGRATPPSELPRPSLSATPI